MEFLIFIVIILILLFSSLNGSRYPNSDFNIYDYPSRYYIQHIRYRNNLLSNLLLLFLLGGGIYFLMMTSPNYPISNSIKKGVEQIENDSAMISLDAI